MPTELEDLLRRSLHAEVEQVEPSTEGLRRIRERTVRPAPVRWKWRTPVLVLTGAAAVVAALVAAPSVLPSLTSPPARTTAAAPTSAGPTPIPGAGVNDMRTVWPYATRADGFRDAPADQAAGFSGPSRCRTPRCAHPPAPRRPRPCARHRANPPGTASATLIIRLDA